MMRKKINKSILFWAASMVITISAYSQNDFPSITNNSFGRGEELNYNVSYGIFNVGQATTRIYHKSFYINGRKCYKIDAYGETAKWVSWFAKVDDNWGAYIDSAALVTHVSYRKIKEGKYRKNEWITFDHKTDSAAVKIYDFETGKYGEPTYYETPNNVRDLVGGFMFLRVHDYSQHKIGDTLTISGFFEDTSYTLPVLYDGIESIEVKAGSVMCHRIVPVMPDNKLFDGENSITCWISADKNQIPVKIFAKMFVGGILLELTSYKNLKQPLK